ncbi:MAG: Gfo/Idh/MocA family oxidoreductase [Alphaproteobacteria bacterium]|nr:Gfo/Idh/MocA family oxidoreductase [Alphaproteobacteria bacterium]
MRVIKVGLCGYGYWGQNLLRTFSGDPRFKVVAVSDLLENARERLRDAGTALRLYPEATELVDDPQVEAVAVATPAATHFRLVRRAILAGKHVLVEKPMCASAAEAQELVALAERSSATLMVDHTYLFHGAVRKLRELYRSGALGAVSYYDSLRVNLGLFQPDLNVLWDLGPHDFSIMDYLFDEDPLHVEATGYCHVNAHLPDIAYVTVHFASNVIAHFNLSWMSPVKVRRIAIGGSKRMAVWDDLNREEKLKIYNSGISFHQEEERSHIMPSYRIGDIYSPRVWDREPLAEVVAHFGNVIAGREPSIMDGRKGLRIVDLLERAQTSLDASLRTTSALRQAAE